MQTFLELHHKSKLEGGSSCVDCGVDANIYRPSIQRETHPMQNTLTLVIVGNPLLVDDMVIFRHFSQRSSVISYLDIGNRKLSWKV